MLIDVPDYRWVPADIWPWRHFTPKEMACRSDGSLKVHSEFMDALQLLRARYDRPMIVSSAYRTPAYNVQVSSTGPDGPHTTGRAVDIRVYGTWAWRLMGLAIEIGFTGVGVQQKGPQEGRFIHLDMIPGYQPRPWVWSY